MYHTLPPAASFWPFLFKIDQDLAETTRRQGCRCGGLLHRADYRRQPRPDSESFPDTYKTRFSFCCNLDGCRKRATPPSVRFLGRKIYVGAVVILVSAMRHGPSPRRVRELSKHLSADRRTIVRWQEFWREQVPQTGFWKVAGAPFALHSNLANLPLSLLTAFVRQSDDHDGWGRLLHFLSPITTTTDPPS